MTSHLDIAGRRVGSGEPCYIIGEAGSNHDGSLDQAFALIQAAARAGVDAVKFQAIQYDRLWIAALQDAAHQAFYRSVELAEAWLPRLAAAAAAENIHFLCSPTYIESVRLIDLAGAPAFKVASPQTVGDPPLLREVARTGKPAIVSTGYADWAAIDEAVGALRGSGCTSFALLHCVAEYPVPAERVNLRAMGSMTERYGCPVGLSDHTEGIHVASAAVALGACIIEKHFTTDRQRPGPDHSFALEPDGLAAMVSHIRDVERALGDGRRDRNTTGDRDQIARVTVRAVARRAIHPGQTVTAADVLFRRAPTGLSAREFEAMGSAIAVEAIAPLSPITEDKLRQIEK